MPAAKLKAYVDAFEGQEIYNKSALNLLTLSELETLCTDAKMSIPMRAAVVDAWKRGA